MQVIEFLSNHIFLLACVEFEIWISKRRWGHWRSRGLFEGTNRFIQKCL